MIDIECARKSFAAIKKKPVRVVPLEPGRVLLNDTLIS
jgi:hypothetical protein